MKSRYTVAAFSALALTMGFTACDDDDYNDWAEVQTNAEETVVSLTFSVSSINDTIKFEELTEDDEYVTVFNPTITTNIDSITTTYTITLAETVTLDATESGQVLASELQSAIETIYGVAGKTREIPGYVIAYNSDGGVTFKRTGEVTVYAALVAPEFDEFIYVPGNGQNNWTPATAPALRSENMDGVYTGFAYLDGGFKFTLERNWNSEYNYTNFSTFSDVFEEDASSTNIICNTAGYYYIVADVANKSLTATSVNWGICGSVLDSNWSTYADMTMNVDSENITWYYTGTFEAGEFKFLANHEWTINLGGSQDDLSQDGSNLSIATAGTYTIKLYASRIDSDNLYYTIAEATEEEIAAAAEDTTDSTETADATESAS